MRSLKNLWLTPRCAIKKSGQAFASICSQTRTHICLVMPEHSLLGIYSKDYFYPNVQLVSAGGNCDYFDAIRPGKNISSLPNFFAEGGTANVGRRDGMGLTVVDSFLCFFPKQNKISNSSAKT